MTGAESLVRTAIGAGVRVCFANPGTTEIGLVKAIDSVAGMRAVLGLFEGVCSGAADGYARMTDSPALALFHLGPGFANAVANLHNARRARSPIVNVIGDHATWHLGADAPLTSDIESLARPVSRWVRRTASSERLAQDTAEAIASAKSGPGGVATLIVPSDCQSDAAKGPADPLTPEAPRRVPRDRIGEVAAGLRELRPSALYLGSHALRERGLWAAARIAAKIQCRIIVECFPARLERGAGLPRVERLPYFPEQVSASLAGLERLVLAGAPEPVSFFGYPGVPSRLTPAGCTLSNLASPEDDVPASLESLADALEAPAASPALLSESKRPGIPDGPLTVDAIGAVLALLQPEGAIVVDESGTSGLRYFQPSAGSPRHTLLALTGGAIGFGPPCATGAAIACPDRAVIDFQGDGAAAYTLQALWTQAREQLHVVTLICSNRSYAILRVEMARAGGFAAGSQAAGLFDLSRPEIDWVGLARAVGVPGTRADSAASLRNALGRAFAEPGPHLIEMQIQSDQ
jgi:acetolactate synthase-1/2/3 large subunit